MRETLIEIASLQLQYTHENTPAMERRGHLVRRVLPAQILERRAELSDALGVFGADLDAKGRDGTGRKAHVPWSRFYSRRMSPTPRDGWYVVYLVHPDGSGVSLCLSHGSTTFEDGGFHGKSDDEVGQLMGWAARVVGGEFTGDAAVRPGIRLGTNDLAEAYERTTVFSKFYAAGAMPSDDLLTADLVAFARVLAKLYDAKEHGLAPSSVGPEVALALDSAEQLASPLKERPPGQGRGLPPVARKAVELHAMVAAAQWLKDHKFNYKDVSKNDSCDFRAERDGEHWIVEVKGTTGGPGSILITRKEVALHRKAHPHNILIVVHGIELATDGYSTSGGVLIAREPWSIEEDRLSPICYEYRLS